MIKPPVLPLSILAVRLPWRSRLRRWPRATVFGGWPPPSSPPARCRCRPRTCPGRGAATCGRSGWRPAVALERIEDGGWGSTNVAVKAEARGRNEREDLEGPLEEQFLRVQAPQTGLGPQHVSGCQGGGGKGRIANSTVAQSYEAAACKNGSEPAVNFQFANPEDSVGV